MVSKVVTTTALCVAASYNMNQADARGTSTRNVFGIRGGSVATQTTTANAANAELRKYKMQQQHLLQLRSTYLSEALASRGISVGPTIIDVATLDGAKPPQLTDWDCCLSTHENPQTCLYSFDAEPNTKVIAPAGTTQYISLSALNRLRRTDPSKVEPMWHSQYAILAAWFRDASPYSLLQFVGWKGFIVSTLLLDSARGLGLRMLLALAVMSTMIMSLPLLEIVAGRLLTCSTLWMKWMSWGKFVHAALPLKILLGQMGWKFMAGSFGKLEAVVKEYLVDLECAILEESIPVTIRHGLDDLDGSDGSEEDDLSALFGNGSGNDDAVASSDDMESSDEELDEAVLDDVMEEDDDVDDDGDEEEELDLDETEEEEYDTEEEDLDGDDYDDEYDSDY